LETENKKALKESKKEEKDYEKEEKELIVKKNISDIKKALNNIVKKPEKLDITESADKETTLNKSLGVRLKNSEPNSEKILKILKQEKLTITLKNVFEIGKRFGDTICSCKKLTRRTSKNRNKNNKYEANKRHNEIHFIFCFLNICTKEKRSTIIQLLLLATQAKNGFETVF